MTSVQASSSSNQLSILVPAATARQHTIDLARDSLQSAHRAQGSAQMHLNKAERLQGKVEELRVQDPKSYKRKQVWKAIGLAVLAVAAAALGLAVLVLPWVAYAMLFSVPVSMCVGIGICYAAVIGTFVGPGILVGAGVSMMNAFDELKNRNLSQVIERTEAERDTEVAAVRQIDLQSHIETLEQWRSSLEHVHAELADVRLGASGILSSTHGTSTGETGEEVLTRLQACNSRWEALTS